MSERSAQIDAFFNQIKAAHLNGIREWHEHGETGARRGLVGMLEVAAAGLQHLLGGVRLTSEQEVEAGKLFAAKQRVEAGTEEVIAARKEVEELMAKSA